MRNLDPVLHPAQPLTVDCSANPYDLRPAVAGIVARVEQVSNHLRSIGSHQKIVVIMGEAHPMPSHILLQAAVLKALQEKHRLVFAFERPHDFLSQVIKQLLNQNITPEENVALRELDHDGKKSLMCELAYFRSHFSPVAKEALNTFLLRSCVPCIFTDASKMDSLEKRILDIKDPVTAAFLPSKPWYKIFLPQVITTFSPNGIAIRNKVMVHLTENFMKAHDADISIQQSGLIHLLGSHSHTTMHESRHDKYKDSLHAIFAKTGLLPIPVFPENKNFTLSELSREGFEAFRDGVYIKGLADDEFESDEMKPLEQIFIQKIMKESSLEPECFVSPQKGYLKVGVMAEAPLWLAEAQAYSLTKM